MQRLKIYGSGRVTLTQEETGEVLEDFIVPDIEKAQEIVMKWIKEKSKNMEEPNVRN